MTTLSSTQTLSVQHISSTKGPHLFSTKNSSVPHTPPFNRPSDFLSEGWLFELRDFKCGTEDGARTEGGWTEGCVELWGFWRGTEGFWELKRTGPFVLNLCVELRRSYQKKKTEFPGIRLWFIGGIKKIINIQNN